MPVVRVRIVGVDMAHPLMAMPMGMRLPHGAVAPMLVIIVVDMAMIVLQKFALVFVGVTLRQMQP
jgi:hypothetical protein